MTAYQRLFKATIQDPWERVIGTRLLSVTYFVLSCDLPGFDVSAPNETSGCQGVLLEFAGGEIELDWDFQEAAFRDEATAFYLVARSASDRSAFVRGPADTDEVGLVRADATHVRPWRSVVGEVLQSVSVWGKKLSSGVSSPQAVSLAFPSGEVAVAIGYGAITAGDWWIGDGDEVLVMDEVQWSEHGRRLNQSAPLELIWRSPMR